MEKLIRDLDMQTDNLFAISSNLEKVAVKLTKLLTEINSIKGEYNALVEKEKK